MFCTKCGTENDSAANFCTNCGAPLSQATVINSNATGVAEEEFYKAYIGSNNLFYYLDRFKRFDGAGKAGATWHWPAFFITFYWLLYRKMWGLALIYFLAPYIIMFVSGLTSVISEPLGAIVMVLLFLFLFIAQWVLIPMYANALYYQQSRKKITSARAVSNDTQRVLGELSGKGGTSLVPVFILGVFGVFAVIGILAAIAIPQYQEYLSRAQVNRAVMMGQHASESVENYYYRNQGLPETLDDAGFNEELPPSVNSITLNNQNGVVTITMSSGALAGKSIEMVPLLDDQGQITWQCTSEDIKLSYLPSQCKQ